MMIKKKEKPIRSIEEFNLRYFPKQYKKDLEEGNCTVCGQPLPEPLRSEILRQNSERKMQEDIKKMLEKAFSKKKKKVWGRRKRT